MELYLVIWVILSILFAASGRNRRIGFGRALLACLLLSPLIGLIIILLSEKHSEILMKYKIAHDSGNLSDEEYDRKVREIIPNKEDKHNEFIGWIVVIVIGLVIYLITIIF